MIANETQIGISNRIEEVRRLCPELRIGQILATVGMLGEDSTGRSFRDLEDNELIEAFERFAADLRNRGNA
jgi:hypothetical protein